jgi:hypothetical protein
MRYAYGSNITPNWHFPIGYQSIEEYEKNYHIYKNAAGLTGHHG